MTRKDRGAYPSAYSYECKDCTKKRVTTSRMTNKVYLINGNILTGSSRPVSPFEKVLNNK